MATRWKFRSSRGILYDMLKINGNLARNINFEVTNFQVLRKTRRKMSILKPQSVKIRGSLVQNPRFSVPTYFVSSFWFSCNFAVFMGEATKFLLLPTVKIGGNFVWNANFSASTCFVSSRCSYGVALFIGEARKPVLLLSCCFT